VHNTETLCTSQAGVRAAKVYRTSERQIVSRMASVVQRDRCVPRVSIGAVFACRAGVEVLHMCCQLGWGATTGTCLQPYRQHPSLSRQIALSLTALSTAKLAEQSAWKSTIHVALGCVLRRELLMSLQRRSELRQQTDVGVRPGTGQLS
jgi:hypothetical protein